MAKRNQDFGEFEPSSSPLDVVVVVVVVDVVVVVVVVVVFSLTCLSIDVANV